MGYTYIAVHGGAGVHSQSNDHEVKRCLKRSCSDALKTLNEGSSALSAVEEAVCILEDDACLNAGYGSNLTLDGMVECDAAVMDGRSSDFGSVGAVSGVKNPVRLARAILEHSRTPDPLGRIPPLTLVSSGAHTFAASENIQTVSPESLVAPRANEEWQKWKDKFDAAARGDEPVVELEGLKDRQDTVGAVAWDSGGGMAAGVSSGGLLLKHPGRIGEAALFGVGCWAQVSPTGTNERGMACSVSGSGEHIVRTSLTRALSDSLNAGGRDVDVHAVLQDVLVEKFWKQSKQRGEPEPVVGVLLLIKECEDEGDIKPRLWCAFTSPSMAIAYASSKNPKPKTVILRRPQRQFSDANPPIFITALPM